MSSALRQPMRLENQTYYPDEIILFPGEPHKLYRLRKGLVRIHTVDDEGNGLTLRYVKPNGYFGEEAVAQTERRYFAEAVTQCEVDILDSSNLSMREYAELTIHLSQSMERMYRALYRLSGKRLKSRIAAELLDLQDSALATINTEGKPIVHMTHDDLAAAVGSVRETVTKVVGELAKSGAIYAGYGKVILNDVELLQSIADE